MNLPFKVGSSRRLRHSCLTYEKVTPFSMSDIFKQCSVANDPNLIQGIRIANKRRRKNILLVVYLSKPFLEFVIHPAPAIKPHKVLIPLVLDLLLHRICLPGRNGVIANQATEQSTHIHESVEGLRITFGPEILLGKSSHA